MSFTVLISCMHQKDACIIERTNVQSDVVVVNQCDTNRIERFTFINKSGRECKATFVYTTQRGLSRSRNMAISLAPVDSVCLICDDDELLEDDIEATILNAYSENPNMSVMAFEVIRKDLPNGKQYPKSKTALGFKQILQTSSVQITFKKNALTENAIAFDELMGSGTGNGGGEENKFLLYCRRKGLMMGFVPKVIATVLSGDSLWFQGCNKEYLMNLGWVSHRSMKSVVGFLYIIYWVLTHRSIYKENFSLFSATYYLIKGFFQNR